MVKKVKELRLEPEFQIYLPHIQIIKKKFALKNQNDHDQFDFPKFLLFMNKMFVLYFALLNEEQNIYFIFAPLHEQNFYFIFCSSSKWNRNNKKKIEYI
jgi:Trk-type K+ transport system membrane component